jgi:hypothetical protein
VKVDVSDKECPNRECYWPRPDPGVFTQGVGYRTRYPGRKPDWLCGNREIRGCPAKYCHTSNAPDQARLQPSHEAGCSQGGCIHTKPSWDDDPVLGPLIREAYSDPANAALTGGEAVPSNGVVGTRKE